MASYAIANTICGMERTAFMISTTHSHARERGLAGTDRAARGMTLVELIIGMTLASVLMTAVLSSFLFLGRSGSALSHYNEMELQARLGLERFAEDVRQASDLAWDSDTQVTLTVGGKSLKTRILIISLSYCVIFLNNRPWKER